MTPKKAKYNKTMIFHIMVLIPLAYIIIFNYVPIMGIIIAFKDFKPGLGIFGSKWVGLDQFKRLFLTNEATRAFVNTLIIATMKIICNLIIPVIFALLLNEIGHRKFKRTVQTITYLPHFLSWVVLSGIFIDFLNPSGGLVNKIITSLGFNPIFFLGNVKTFRGTLVVTDVWKNFGYNAIIYLAALTNIDPTLYEAAAVDGAGRWKQTLFITLPGISNFIALMTILGIGRILNAGFDQVFNLYNVSVYSVGDIIDTLVFRSGIQMQQYSFSTAVGLFRSLVGLILISISNWAAKRYAGYRVF